MKTIITIVLWALILAFIVPVKFEPPEYEKKAWRHYQHERFLASVEK
jgi:hypothetical protein